MAFCPGLFEAARRSWPISDHHYTFSTIVGQEDNASGFQGTPDLMARIFADLEPVGLQAL